MHLYLKDHLTQGYFVFSRGFFFILDSENILKLTSNTPKTGQ
jgi:hypothetical protein